MKSKPDANQAGAPVPERPKRTPRMAAVRRIETERPQRAWSLLLPPSIWSERK